LATVAFSAAFAETESKSSVVARLASMMSVPGTVVVTVAITLDDNRVLGIRQSVRKSDAWW